MNEKSLNQAIIITAYKNFDYLVDLSKDLSACGFYVYIHVDQKVSNENILKTLNGITNVCALTKFSICWGGIKHLLAILLLMRKIYDEHDDVHYIHVISGTDCLCKSVRDFRMFFHSENALNYMKCVRDVPCDLWTRTFYRNEWLNYKTKWGFHLTRLLASLQRLLGISRKCPNGFTVYHGLVWVSITREYLQYILSFMETKEGKKFMGWLKWCFIPEEFFFQTILMNSPFANTLGQECKFALWEMKHGTCPGILDEADYGGLTEPGIFFARKIAPQYSGRLLQMLKRFRNS
jgi:hypothetical protein